MYTCAKSIKYATQLSNDERGANNDAVTFNGSFRD